MIRSWCCWMVRERTKRDRFLIVYCQKYITLCKVKVLLKKNIVTRNLCGSLWRRTSKRSYVAGGEKTNTMEFDFNGSFKMIWRKSGYSDNFFVGFIGEKSRGGVGLRGSGSLWVVVIGWGFARYRGGNRDGMAVWLEGNGPCWWMILLSGSVHILYEKVVWL